MENSLAAPKNAKYRITVWSNNSTPTYTHKRIENEEWNKYLYASVHCRTIRNGQNDENNPGVYEQISR